MPFPTDPIKAEEARAKMRASQALRWQRPEEREKSRQAALRQFADPAVRQKMRESKLNYFKLPESRQKVRDAMQRYYAKNPMRRQELVERMRVIGKRNHEARDSSVASRSPEELRIRRLALIKERACSKST